MRMHQVHEQARKAAQPRAGRTEVREGMKGSGSGMG